MEFLIMLSKIFTQFHSSREGDKQQETVETGIAIIKLVINALYLKSSLYSVYHFKMS